MEADPAPVGAAGPELPALAGWERRALALVRRYGITGFMVLSTLASVVASLVMVTALMAFTGGLSDPDYWPTAYAMSTVIPAVVAPSVTLVMAKLISRLDELTMTLGTQAVTDALTGIGNRRGFFDHATRQEEAKSRLALAVLDVDRFKSLNDLYGHPTGDRALRAVATWLSDRIDSAGYVARFGGDEFVAIAEAGVIAELGTSATFDLDGVSFTASIGRSAWSPGQDIDAAVAAADAELYDIKSGAHQSGR